MLPIERARFSLDGLSIGDAFGERFFGREETVLERIDNRLLPKPQWDLTDDSIMAIGVVEPLEACRHVDQDYLAERFAKNYRRNPRRGYGGMAHDILQAIQENGPGVR